MISLAALGCATDMIAQLLPFTTESALDDNNGDAVAEMDGWVTAIEGFGGKLILNVISITDQFDDLVIFGGGTIRIAGGPPMTIFVTTGMASDPAPSVEVDGLRLPFRAVDDDDLFFPDGMDVPEPDISGMAPVYGKAYIFPIRDTGQDTPNATFHAYTTDDMTANGAHLLDSRGSPPSGAPFWVVQVKNVFQTQDKLPEPDQPPVLNLDMDPDIEDTFRAAAVRSSGGVFIAVESVNDWIRSPLGANGVDPDPTGEPPPWSPTRQSRVEEIINHEVGHLFGLIHPGEPGGAPASTVDVMQPSPTRKSSTFSPHSINIIRNHISP